MDKDLYLCYMEEKTGILGSIMEKLGISEIVIEPISMRVKNITLGIHTQDSYDDTDPDNIIEFHTVTIGFFFVRFTFEFVSHE